MHETVCECDEEAQATLYVGLNMTLLETVRGTSAEALQRTAAYEEGARTSSKGEPSTHTLRFKQASKASHLT